MENLRAVKASFEDYVYWNGHRLADEEFGLNIKNGKTEYYIVFDGEKYFAEFLVFLDDMELNLNVVPRVDEIAKVMMEALKENHDILNIKFSDTYKRDFDLIKDYVEVLEENEDVYNLEDGRTFVINNIKCKLK